jgi:hypothetical protein
MRGVAFASVVAVAQASLPLTWTDCSDDSYLVKLQTVTPDILTQGETTTITGTGILSKEILAGEGITASASIQASVIDCIGDASVGKKCNFPLDMGSLEFLGMQKPYKAGEIPVNVDLKISRLLPATLLKTTTKVTAKGAESGNTVFCLEVFTVRSPDSHLGVGILDVTWSDCGDADTKAVVHDLQPPQLKQGSVQHIVGTGTLAEDVDEEIRFEVDMSVAFLGCTGDGVAGKKCEFPLDQGYIEFKGIEEPLAAGEQSIDVDLKLTKIVPDGSKTTTHVTAVTASGDKLFCLDVFTCENDKCEDIAVAV